MNFDFPYTSLDFHFYSMFEDTPLAWKHWPTSGIPLWNAV